MSRLDAVRLSKFDLVKQKEGSIFSKLAIFSQPEKHKSILFAQLICTHYSFFENIGRFAKPKKVVSKIWGGRNKVLCFW
jgi:hypothetical protein